MNGVSSELNVAIRSAALLLSLSFMVVLSIVWTQRY